MTLTPRLLLMLTLPPLLWAGNAIAGRLTVPLVPPLLLNLLRWVTVAVVLLVIGRRAIATAEARAAIRARWRYLALVGLLGVGAYNSLQYLALTTSTPINVTLIASSMPLWMLLVGFVFFHERPQARQVMGAALSLAGVATVLGRGDWSKLAQIHFVQGDLYMLLASACWAGYSWLLVRPPASMQPANRPRVIGVDGQPRPWNWAEYLLVQTLFGLFWSSTSAGLEAVMVDRVAQWTPAVAVALVYITIGPSLLAYKFWGEAVANAGPTTAGIFVNLTPLFAALMSTAMLGEAPQGFHGVAFALIVAGIVVSSGRR